MSRSNLPQSDADRIAAAVTAVAIAAIVWVILAVSPNPRDFSTIAAAHAATARHVDEGNRATAGRSDAVPARQVVSGAGPT